MRPSRGGSLRMPSITFVALVLCFPALALGIGVIVTRPLTFISGFEAALLIAFFLYTILTAVLFSSRARRYSRIAAAIEQFEAGNCQNPIQCCRNDDIGELEQAFNRMSARVVSSMEALQTNDKQRRELIANISHDLRSPLTSIQGYLETLLMLEDSGSQKERREYLQIALRNTHTLVKLVKDLFELSKLEAKSKKLAAEKFDISQLLQDLFQRFRPRAEGKGIKLSCLLPEDLPPLVGDRLMMDRALSNLIVNALYYTGNGGRVEIKVVLGEKYLRILVSDDGIGIPEEELPHIFERFYRVNKDRSKSTGGSGLGLAITKEIIDSHGGSINISSQVGQGTTVEVALGLT